MVDEMIDKHKLLGAKYNPVQKQKKKVQIKKTEQDKKLRKD